MPVEKGQEIIEAFCRAIKSGRKRNHLSQTEMAQRLGMSQSGYSMIETGEREPNLSVIVKIARILDIDLGEFIDDLDSK